MKLHLIALLGILADCSAAAPRQDQSQRAARPFDFAVLFGDSYTDDGIANYYFTHGGQFPPSGTVAPETDDNATGGQTWAQFLESQTGATVYDFAIGGSTCSNKIVSRTNPFLGNIAVPSVLDEMVPYLKNQSTSSLFTDATAENTVYAIWIGTNDLGVNAFLTDNQEPGKTPADYVECIWSAFDGIYATGARRLILLNNNALDLAPLYQLPSKGGVTSSFRYWANKTDYDQQQIHDKMTQLVNSTNSMMQDDAPSNIQTRWPDADFTIFNVHQLMTDIYYNPDAYLEAPANSTWFYNDCPSTGCPADRHLDSWMYYDELHPSPKTETFVASEFVKVAAKESKYGIYF